MIRKINASFDNTDFEIVNVNATKKHIDGTVNKKSEIMEYKGGDTNTASVSINNRTIYVNAKIDVDKIEKEYQNVQLLFKQVKTEYNKIAEQIIAYESRFNAQDKKLEDFSIILNTYSKKIEAVEKEIACIDNSIKNIQLTINENSQQIENNSKNIANLKVNVSDINKNIRDTNTEIIVLSQRLDNISQTILPLIESKLKELSDKVDSKLVILENKVNTNKIDADNKISDLSTKTAKDINDLDTKVTKNIEFVKNELAVDVQRLDKDLYELKGQTEKSIDDLDEKITSDISATKTLLENEITNLSTETSKKFDKIEDSLEDKLDKSTYEYDKSIIDITLDKKGAAMYYDANGEFDVQGKSYWYMTSNNDASNPHIIAGPYNFGSGGGGGGAVTTEVSIKAVDWPSMVSYGTDCKLKVLWSSLKDGTPTGNGTLAVYVDSTLCFTQRNNPQGIITLDVTKYLKEGTNSVEVRVTDAYSNTDKVIQELTTVQINIKSSFDANKIFSGDIDFRYTPYGAGLTKVIHFLIDDIEIGTDTIKSSAAECSYIIRNLTHGAHILKTYFSCQIDGNDVVSNELVYGIIYTVEGNTTPIISSTFKNLEQEQYTAFSIPYRAYTPLHMTSEIELYINGQLQKEIEVGQDIQYWETRPIDFGLFEYKIKCQNVEKVFLIDVKQAEIDVEPVTQSLALYLTSTGRSNSEKHPEIWEDKDNKISCTLSGFNFVSDGWVQDEDGNTILKVTGDDRVFIPYKPFEKDFRTTGKTIELEFSTSDIKDYETSIISCLSMADYFSKKQICVDAPDRKKEFRVNLDIEKFKEKVVDLGTYEFKYINGWKLNDIDIDLNTYGISLVPYIIDDSATDEDPYEFNQDIIQVIYSEAGRGFNITPQLAFIKSQQSELQTQYKEDEHVRISFVIEKRNETRVIYMYINGIMSGAYQYPDTDNFRQLTPMDITIGSNDATVNIYNIRIYDNNLTRRQIVNNWIADTQNGQLKKERFVHNDNYNDSEEIVISKLPTDIPYIIWDIDPLPQFKGDKRKGQAYYTDPINPKKSFKLPTKDGVGQGDYNVQGTSSSVYPVKNIRLKSKGGFIDNDLNVNKEFSITDNGIGANYFTFKVDYASSEGANNVELTKLYNDASKSIGILTPPQRINNKVRVGIDGFPIVAFHRDATGKDTFCTKANFNNDKANEAVYGFGPGDESWEITNNSADEGNFKKPATPETFANAFEIRFPDEDDYSDLSKLGPMTEWICSTDTSQATNLPLDKPITYTYTEVVRSEDGTYSTRTVVSPEFTTDSTEYRLTKFKAELKDWFNIDSTVFYYIFTHLYLMIDSRAKNAFPTYFASRQEGDGGDRWFWLPYDMDTAIGINNEGKLVFDYNLEDTDKIDGANVFNGQDSVLWNNLRIAFDGEIGQMYSNLRTSGSLISFDETEARFEKHQNKWSENIFNEDSYVKYIKVLIETGDNYLEMLQGSKAQQRKWWLYNRFKYFDSKYLAGDAKQDVFQFRAYGKADVTITPYADIYATVSYANAAGAVVSVRAKRGQSYTLPNPLPASASDQETYIYSASQLKSVGDLSPFKPDTVKAANAIKLQELKIGDKSTSYQNPNLRELTLGKNVLLKTLDVRNCINLSMPIDIQNCTGIEEVYFDNTQITNLLLPASGSVKKLHLPDSITNLTIKNQPNLKELEIAGTHNVQTLWLENIPSDVIDAKKIIMEMPSGSEVRLIGFNQNVLSAEEIYALYDLLDTMTGLNAQGESVEVAEISGNIYIDEILYSDYYALTHHMKNGKLVYQDIKIIAKRIICKVDFYTEGKLYNTQNVLAGNSAERPEDPEKESTQQYYYVFEGWDKDFSNIETDLSINAIYSEHLQVYEVKFNTQTSLVHVDSQFIDYGSLAIKPEDPYIYGATFLGWYTEPNTINEFDFNTQITGYTELYAKWRDDNIPEVTINRLSYNKFEFVLTDNIAVTDYAITNSDEVPQEWISITPTAEYRNTYVINHADTYYVWAKDASGDPTHTVNNYIIAYNLITQPDIGTEIELYEGENKLQNFATQGTVIYYNCVLDDHYENLVSYKNGEIIENYSSSTIDTDFIYSTECNPKTYIVKFNIGEYGEQIEDQYIVYLNKVIEPTAQYVEGKIIEGWYTDPLFIEETRWNFAANLVYDNITLYANWIDYTEPSIIYIITQNDNQEVKLNFYQTVGYGVVVDWGDGSDKQTSGQYYGNQQLSHIYTEQGSYQVKVWGEKGLLYLGAGYGLPMIQPAEIIKDVEFAWNLATTSAYALQGATNLTTLNIPRFMSELAIGICYDCTNLVNINLPDNLKVISGQAFRGCTGLVGEFKLPVTVTTIGEYAFSNCSNITKFIIHDAINSIGPGAFSYTGITEFTIPTGITQISSALLQGCTNIKEIYIPEYITVVGDNAFNNCENLEKVVITNKDCQIGGDFVFNGCMKLYTAGPIGGNYDIEFAWEDEIPNKVFSVGVSGSALHTVILPETITRIGDFAFGLCSNLKNINLPLALVEIGQGAFSGCSVVKFDELPANLKYIGASAFTRCYAIINITIPASVETIGNRAFEYDYAIKNVYLYTTASENKIDTYVNSWFNKCTNTLILHISSSVIDPTLSYGPYWNYYDDGKTLEVQTGLEE